VLHKCLKQVTGLKNPPNPLLPGEGKTAAGFIQAESGTRRRQLRLWTKERILIEINLFIISILL
jgi:hypothetical protein